MEFTYLDSNSWLITLGGKRILLDPWLVGPLMFGDTPWLFQAQRRQPIAIPEAVDVILLSQGLPDHAHPPTLAQLPKAWPVVTSPNGEKLVRSLNYETVHSLHHGEAMTLGSLQIQAFPGSPVGPTLRENAYVLQDLMTGHRVYYEPHGFHDRAILEGGGLDVVITPLINLSLPLLGPVIKGQATALALCERVRPQYAISTAAGGDLEFRGWLLKFLKAEGTVANFQTQLAQAGLMTQAIDPPSQKPFTLDIATTPAIG